MQRLTKADCYVQVIMIAARVHDNEILQRAVVELAERVGPDAVRLLERTDIKADAWENIDRKDRRTWEHLLLTAGMILELLRRKERPRRHDRPPTTTHTCCA